MRVLFVSESIWTLGPVYDLHMLAEGLAECGDNVFAIDPGQWADKLGDKTSVTTVARYISKAPITVISPRILPIKSFIPIWRDSWIKSQYEKFRARFWEMDKLMKSTEFDVIVLYSVARMGLITIILARKYGIPVVFRNVDMLHKLWASRIDQFIVRQLEKIVYRSVTWLCALTPMYAEYMNRLGANQEKISMILFPIDTMRFKSSIKNDDLRLKWKIQAEEKIVLFMGTLYRFGGVISLVKSFETLIDKMPNIRLLIVGDGVIRQELIELVNIRSLNKNVTITGHEPFELMPSYINLADICVNAFPINKFTGNIFSAKIVQYLACGKPTISSALPGITTVIPDKDAGVLYCNTIEEIVFSIEKLLLDDSKRIKMSKDAEIFAAQTFEFLKIIKDFRLLLKNIINNKNEN